MNCLLTSPAPHTLSSVQLMRRAANRLVSAPTLFLTIPQSISNVFEEFLERVLLHKPDIIGVSETWFSINKPAKDYTLDGCQQLTKDRLARAEGVALYAKNHLYIRKCNIDVPPDLECVWTKIVCNFTYNVKTLFGCSLYYPPKAPHCQQLIDHLIETVLHS